MSRLLPKIAFVGVMVFAAMLSADLGPSFVSSHNVIVWYEPGISQGQAQAFLDVVTRDLDSEGTTSPAEKIKIRLMREPQGIRVRFDNLNFAKLTPETTQFFNNYGQQLGATAWPGEKVRVELSDGAGKVQPLDPPTAPQQAEREVSSPVTSG